MGKRIFNHNKIPNLPVYYPEIDPECHRSRKVRTYPGLVRGLSGLY